MFQTNSDGSKNLIFKNDVLFKQNVIEATEDIYCDATFKAVPVNPTLYQLFVVSIGSGSYVSIFFQVLLHCY